MEHTHIIGSSGTGKSTLAKRFIIDAIYAGHGVLYLDPQGEDTDDLLQYIPYERRNDVILFDPSDEQYPIAFNPLEVDTNIAVITSAFENGIKDVAGYSTTSTPTMSLYIRASLAALIEAGEPLTGLNFILTSGQYRDQVLSKVSDQLIRRFWKNFEVLTPKERRQEIASTYNKAFALILDSRIRNILGQKKSALHMNDVLGGKILLARLPQGKLGLEQVKVLGILLLSQFHLSALARRAGPPCQVFIDECHNFDGGTLCEMLSGIRKYNVGLTVIHQNLEQLSRRLRFAIQGNTAHKYVFRVSMRDSKELNERLGPDNYHTDLFKLPPYKTRHFYGEEDTEKTISPLDFPTDKRVPKIIRCNMRRNFARPEKAVKVEIDSFIDGLDIAKPKPKLRK